MPAGADLFAAANAPLFSFIPQGGKQTVPYFLVADFLCFKFAYE
ncbi:hypothetical protein ADIAL_1929 [Alkalibacterium sp. AK22]|nr:hypothetical protein ADIAL_1929 [Alkalibacterium sp. AK22]